MNTKEFIKKSEIKHNYIFDYSKVEYKTNKNKVEIICKKHGSFFQIAQDHLRGFGCKKCSFEKRKISINEFIERGNNKHLFKYDYSLVEFEVCEDNNMIEKYNDRS